MPSQTLTGEKVYNSVEVMEVTGLTYRQFDYFQRVILGRHTGTGQRRTFDRAEVLEMAMLGELIAFGFPVSRAHQLISSQGAATGVVQVQLTWPPLIERVTKQLVDLG